MEHMYSVAVDVKDDPNGDYDFFVDAKSKDEAKQKATTYFGLINPRKVFTIEVAISCLA